MVASDHESFVKRPYRDKKLKAYFGRMSKDNLHHIWDDNIAVALMAQGFNIPDQPKSIYRVNKLFEALQAFAPGKIHSPITGREYLDGIALAWKCFGRKAGQPKLEVMPLNPTSVEELTSNPTGSAGLTAPGMRKSGVRELALMQCKRILWREKKPEPCLAFARTSKNDKTRLVWGYPYSMTIMEGILAKPYIEHLKGGRTPMAFAIASGALGVKLRLSQSRFKYAYSLDMSSFDATISAKLIHEAFNIIKSWYDLEVVETESGVSVKEIFQRVENYFIKTPIVMPDGYMYSGKRHGVPSGSFFTQIVDSIVNIIIIGALGSRFHMHIDINNLYVLGDDVLFFSNRLISLDRLARWANKHFGVKMHGSEKSKISTSKESIHFLGRDWVDGVPHLSVDEILSKMTQPEDFREYPEDPKERWRQVKRMVLSYAAVYWEAWSIASRIINPKPVYYANGGRMIDVNTYYRDRTGIIDVTGREKFMSGLMRFLHIYIYPQRKGSIPHTAVQFWL